VHVPSREFVWADSTSPACRAQMQGCSPGGGCPDLIIDAGRAQSTAYVSTQTFSASSCAVQEGCVGVGTRKLLRFDMAVANVGTGDLHIGNPGSPSLRPCYVWSDCHNHYHFTSFASYELLRNGQVVAVGSKSSTCLQDAYRWTNTAGTPTLPSNQLFMCANQGIHRGYQDLYGAHLDCQWVRLPILRKQAHGDSTACLHLFPLNTHTLLLRACRCCVCTVRADRCDEHCSRQLHVARCRERGARDP